MPPLSAAHPHLKIEPRHLKEWAPLEVQSFLFRNYQKADYWRMPGNRQHLCGVASTDEGGWVLNGPAGDHLWQFHLPLLSSHRLSVLRKCDTILLFSKRTQLTPAGRLLPNTQAHFWLWGLCLLHGVWFSLISFSHSFCDSQGPCGSHALRLLLSTRGSGEQPQSSQHLLFPLAS